MPDPPPKYDPTGAGTPKSAEATNDPLIADFGRAIYTGHFLRSHSWPVCSEQSKCFRRPAPLGWRFGLGAFWQIA
jgi:hypothetical protein